MPILLLLLFLSFCDLQNRFPDEGEFCVPMSTESKCLEVDFRNKKLVFEKEEIPLELITRVQYKFIFQNEFYELQVLSEHRVQILKLESNQSKLVNIFIRKKGPKKSISKRIKEWWNREK